MKRVHVIVVVVLLVILFGFMFFMRKKERYSRDASLILGDEHLKNKTFEAGTSFVTRFNDEIVKDKISVELEITSSPDFTGTFDLEISNDKASFNLKALNASDIKNIKLNPGGTMMGTISGSETSNTKASLQINVNTGTLTIGFLYVIADGPVKGVSLLSHGKTGSPTPAPGSTIGPVKNVNSFGSTIGSPTPARVYSDEERIKQFITALQQNTSLNQNEITIVVNAVIAFAVNPTSPNMSEIRRLQHVYAGKFPDEKEKKDKLNQAIAPLVSPGIEKMMEKNHTVSGTYECSSDSTGFACKLHTL